MVKMLASIAVILVALAMALGLKYVGDKNQSASTINTNYESSD